ncbi:hypothetical protein [Legionella sp. km772]|uniref:hypothetical protein n=1 Tax=Legionella sp. km772 TaxID=2498111 RepID=UPI000F8C5E7E|nr:hypothetical protein [Legionella sp. km772]RUR12800.1 hypothetical protein ELY15_03960 [Legionella sp. km772]
MDVIINADSLTSPGEAKTLVSQGSALLNLLSCLDYDTENPPLAALLAQYHQLEGDWLILNPAHWQASHNNVAIIAFGKELGLDKSELETIFHRFSAHLRQNSMALYYHDEHIWLVSSTHNSLLKTKPIHQILNKPLMFELAAMDDTMYWQKFLTESQMFFSTLNNQPVINGVWLWGGGLLGEKKNTKIITDSSFFEIAQLCSTDVSLYEASSSLNHCDLLLLSDISVLNKTHQEQLEKREVCWYWNNQAYAYSPASWLTRLWRTFVHAH